MPAAGSAGSASVASEFREALKCWFFTMILALFPGIGDLLFVKVAFGAPKVTSSRKGIAHRQNLYTQTPDSPHACGRLVLWCCLYRYSYGTFPCSRLIALAVSPNIPIAYPIPVPIL